MAKAKDIKKRKLFYFSGFDPRGARFYHSLYREQSAKQSGLTDYNIEVGRRRKDAEYISSWNIIHKRGKTKTETEYSFMHWDDFIRKFWWKNSFVLWLYAIIAYFFYTLSRTALRVYDRKGSLTTFLYPLVFMILFVLLSFLAASYFDNTFLKILVFFGVLYLFSKLERFLNIYWLLRIYIFCCYYGLVGHKDLEGRIDKFCDTIIPILNDKKYDEVLLVGHSVGSIILVSVVARILERNPDFKGKIKMLTLGQCIGLSSFLIFGQDFKRKLKIIAASKNVEWLDVTSLVDGACISQKSPFYAVTEDITANVKLISPRFHTMFSPKRYKRFKLNKFMVHFQYLMASDKLTEYDYFDLTSGNKDFLKNFSKDK